MTTRNQPVWWHEQFSTTWERMKVAFQRDWEQTKADVSAGGRDLNQNAGDTLRQVAGSQPIPAPATPNVPDAADMKRHERQAVNAKDHAEKLERKALKALAAGKDRPVAQERAVEARKESSEKDAKLAVNQGLKWGDIEESYRYGFGAGLHHVGAVWNDALEKKLSEEFVLLYPDHIWAESRESVRSGWNSARSSQ